MSLFCITTSFSRNNNPAVHESDKTPSRGTRPNADIEAKHKPL